MEHAILWTEFTIGLLRAAWNEWNVNVGAEDRPQWCDFMCVEMRIQVPCNVDNSFPNSLNITLSKMNLVLLCAVRDPYDIVILLAISLKYPYILFLVQSFMKFAE